MPIETEPEPSKYDLVVLLALNPIRVRQCTSTRASSYQALRGTEYGRLPWLALSVFKLGGYTSSAASEARGCHSIAQLIMSDLQTSMGDDRDDRGILQMIVSGCLRVRAQRQGGC